MKYLPFILPLIFVLYVIIIIFLVPLITRRIFFYLCKKYNDVEVESLPYTCRLSNLPGMEMLANCTLILAFGVLIPSFLIFLGLKRFTPGITQGITLIDLLIYGSGVCLLFLGILSIAFFTKKGASSIEITDQYIDFRWRHANKNNLDGKVLYSSVSKVKVYDRSISMVIGDQEVNIPLVKIMCYKSYNKVIDMLQQEGN